MAKQPVQQAVEVFVARGGSGKQVGFGLDKGSRDEVGAGIFYHDRKLNERFLSVVS